MATPSPCVGLCRIDEASGLCLGCARSASEISVWRGATPAVLERIWSELPRRRRRLGIRVHRLGWDRDRIHSFVSDSVRPGAGTWILGVFGAAAEFRVAWGEPCAVDEAGERLTARTARGAIRFDIPDQVRALAITPLVGPSERDVIVLAVPRESVRLPVSFGLADLGPDRGAILPGGRERRLFDLGVGASVASFCVRGPADDPGRGFEERLGQGRCDPLAVPGGRGREASPIRVVLTPIGRVEVYSPIPPPNGHPPDGPQTHFIPSHLTANRETPPGLDLPNALAPCAIFYPHSCPGEANACPGTTRAPPP